MLPPRPGRSPDWPAWSFSSLGSRSSRSLLALLSLLCKLFGQVVKPGVDAGAGFGRGFEDSDAGPNLVDVLERQFAVKPARLGNIHLGNHRGIRRVEQRGIFQ